MTPGQVAYEKWCREMLHREPQWERNSAKEKWEAVAAAAIDWYKTNNVVVPFDKMPDAESTAIFHSMCDVTDPCDDDCKRAHTLNHPGSDRWIGGDKKDAP